MRYVATRISLAIILVAFLIRPATAEPMQPFLGIGTTITTGSRDYRKLSFYGQTERKTEAAYPYGWAQLSTDNFNRQFALGGGLANELSKNIHIEAGLGFTLGYLKDSDRSSNSFTIETEMERYYQWSTLGLDYRFTSGAIGGSRSVVGTEESVRERFHKRFSQAKDIRPDPYTYQEFSGYAYWPVRETSAGLRLTVGLPSYSSSILSGMLSWKIPVAERLSLSTSVVFEQGHASSRYFSLGFYYLLD